MTLAATHEVERLGAEELLEQLVERFHPRLYVACSFQKEASVIMDMLLRIEPSARFFTLDTGLLFPETYATWRALEERYGVKIDVYQGMSLARQRSLHGDALWARDPDACCGIRKVAPLKEALADVDCWISGLRREQSPLRADTPKLHWDDRHGLYKANPLADWSERDVWNYIFKHDIPYNALHDRGYESIGCTHCTVPGSGRDGRWAGTEKTECGLHG
ncbi:MAG: phosphoadenylyl-sulfate reductase [Thermoleophilaceae bacterium]|nr:phosphoadenylyl-sulfate reductase [Thermoleophilaceae bacterium]